MAHQGDVETSSSDEDLARVSARILRAIRRRWMTFVVVLFLSFGSILAFVLATPKQYAATSRVSIVESDPELDVEGRRGSLFGNRTYFQTQLEILQSAPVLEEVIHRLNLMDRDIVESHPVAKQLKALIAWLVKKERKPPTLYSRVRALERLISVAPVRASDVVKVTSYAGDAQLAADINNTVVQVFSERNLKFKRSKSNADREYLSERLGVTKRDLVSAERALRRFEEERDTIALEKRIDYITELRIAGDGELADLDQQIQEVEARLKPLMNQLATARKGFAQSTAENYAGLRQKALDLRGRRAALLKVYTLEHPQVRALDEELSVLEKQVAETERSVIAGKAGSAGGMENVLSQYNKLLQELEGLRAGSRSLQVRLDLYREKLRADLGLKSEYDLLQREVEANRKIYELLLIREKEASMKADMQISDIRAVENAVPPQLPVVPRVLLSAVIGAILSLGVALCAVFLRDWTDDVVRSTDRLVLEAGAPSLTVLPRLSRSEAAAGRTDLTGQGPLADAVTVLSLSGELSSREDPAKVFMVTSALPGEGKTTVATHLAAAFGLGSDRTLLIDCDLRRPRVASALGGLQRSCSVRELVEDPDRELSALDELPTLTVVASVRPDRTPGLLLGQNSFALALMRLRRRFDRIVIDTPPVLAVSDALHIAPLVDRVVAVTRHGKSSITRTVRMVERLREVRGRVAGLVVNDVPARHSTEYGYEGQYGYGYGYGYGPADGVEFDGPSVPKAKASESAGESADRAA